VARSLRDLLPQRWLLTEQTYEAANAKRVYYLSMEFLIGRSLINNTKVTSEVVALMQDIIVLLIGIASPFEGKLGLNVVRAFFRFQISHAIQPFMSIGPTREATLRDVSG
jgi:hypothetical protein